MLGKVEGTLASGAVAEVRLYGFTAGFSLAREVKAN